MKRMISIVDLTTGQISERPSDTRTLDLPADFDRTSGTAALDGSSHAHYSSLNGKSVSCAVHPRPLSWRVRGEECLVARAAQAASPSDYTLCAIEPGDR